jgi:hypothetical protein
VVVNVPYRREDPSLFERAAHLDGTGPAPGDAGGATEPAPGS